MKPVIRMSARAALILILALLLPAALHAQEVITFAAFADYGVDNNNELAVANLVKSWNPDFIITTGDNVYGSAIDDLIGKYYADYIGDYHGSYGPGSAVNRFFPAMGNHDWTDTNQYFNYFTLPGNERYYDFVKGPVHFFVIDSNPAGSGSAPGDGRSASSTQGQWLQAGLAASSAPWKIVYMHHSPYSSGSYHGSETAMRWPYEAWGATAVISSHDHLYERILRDDNSNGVSFPYFIAGTGGNTLYDFENTPITGSRVRYNASHGAMKIVASESQITFEFWAVTGGGTQIDSYTLSKPEWMAFNDLAWASGQLQTRITRITSPTGGSGLPSSGELVEYADGSGTGVTLTVTGGSYSQTGNGSQGAASYTSGSDGYYFFNGKVSGLGVLSYVDAAPTAGDLVLTFSGMDPDRRYELVFYGQRNDYGWDRAALATLSGADDFINESSAGRDNNNTALFSNAADASTRLPADNDAGYVSRFTNIDPGSDGQVVLTISYNGNTSSQYRGKYGSAVMLASLGMPPQPTCEGDFDVDGDVDGSDLAKIALGQKPLDAAFAGNFGLDDCF